MFEVYFVDLTLLRYWSTYVNLEKKAEIFTQVVKIWSVLVNMDTDVE